MRTLSLHLTSPGLASMAGRLPRDTVTAAFEALQRRKLRTALSVIGIVLGVAAVIAMMSISQGAREDSLRLVEQFGLDNIVVRYRGPGSQGVGQRSSGLTIGDAGRLERLVPSIRAMSPIVERMARVSGPAGTRFTGVLGVTPAYADVLRLVADRGRFLNDADAGAASRVCVLGGAIARQLFGHLDPLGQIVVVQDESFRVVGVLAGRRTDSRGIGALPARDLNNAVLVTVDAQVGHPVSFDRWQRADEIWLRVADGARVVELGTIVARTLEQPRQGIIDFDVVLPRELLDQRYRTQRTFSILIASVAFVSLLVGGIGIMNIMLASVLERTAEIGLRRTVGARRTDIAAQFLLESAAMTALGGIAGITLGAAASWLIARYAGWPTSLSSFSVLLGLVVAGTTGIVFGSYPAIRAARLQPIDAVRYE